MIADEKEVARLTGLPFKEFLKWSGYSQAKLSRRFGIPIRTVENWVAEVNTPPAHVRLMLAEILLQEKATPEHN